jgi:hypothetical protein
MIPDSLWDRIREAAYRDISCGEQVIWIDELENILEKYFKEEKPY